MTNATYRRLSVNAQSTWKKSAARSVAAWARRKTRQDPSCPDGGGMRWARRIFRMVEAATRCPSRRSSPWILTTPHRVFSRARRTISATSSSGRRAARRPGLAPLRHHQPPVPAQQRAGSHDPPGPQPFGHDPRQRGEHGPVGPGHARSGVRPAQHGHLVPQREYLHVLGRRGPGQQREPGQHGHQQPVSQRDTHGCRSCRCRSPRSSPAAEYSTTSVDVFELGSGS